MSKVVIGMSGGVDSSVAAALLVKQGYDVIGVTMKLFEREQAESGCCSLLATEDAKRVADSLGIPFYVMDFTKEFERDVIGNFISEYTSGRTPNPCIVCNKKLKFFGLLNRAYELGADFVATGHYGKVVEKDGRFLLMRPMDKHKDQTYFLYTLNQEQLSHILMPLNDVTKDETRAIATELGLDVANKPDSQEICFIPQGSYREFIEGRVGKSKPGDFVDENGNVVGQHQGIINYTVGQRKGLGIALGKPVFVSKIDPVNNIVYLGEEGCQLSDTVYAKNMNYIPFDTLNDEIRCTAKIRYNAKEAPCRVIPQGDGVKVIFDQPVRSVTPGQALVMYDGDIVIGGGVIESR